MTKINFAAELLMIESICAEARANMLMGNDEFVIAGLERIRRNITRIELEVLSPDKTKIYLAK